MPEPDPHGTRICTGMLGAVWATAMAGAGETPADWNRRMKRVASGTHDRGAQEGGFKLPWALGR